MSGFDAKASMALARSQGASGAAESLADRLRGAAKDGDGEKVGEAAQQFEAFFVQMMLKEMRKAGGTEEGLFSGTEMETFGSMFDQEIAGRIASGEGIGLAKFIEKSFAEAYGAGTGRARIEVEGGRVHRFHTPALVGSDGTPGFSWPLPDGQPGRISSHFGHRSDPLSGLRRQHGGMDIAAPGGTPVLAIGEGRVVRAERSESYGNVVEVEHEGGVVSRYAHQAQLDVRLNDVVQAGEQLGTVGSTGRSTGDHLHLEVRVEGRAVDPETFLTGEKEK